MTNILLGAFIFASVLTSLASDYLARQELEELRSRRERRRLAREQEESRAHSHRVDPERFRRVYLGDGQWGYVIEREEPL
ncbi:hypothetical protein F4805DRAFT_442673 [Annulohypoxylon moriforme]|nr:hypothetical protein F4805DRAFT_442673 [Annulohypoxylon moriforme]